GTMPWYDITSAPLNSERPVVLLALDKDEKSLTSFNSAFITSTRATEKFSRIFTSSGSVKSGESVVLPGETAEFSFDLHTPKNTADGKIHEFTYRPVIPAGGGMSRINVADFSTYYVEVQENA